ncbi:MAG TPA: hypothetical protein VGP64_03745 [Polyangia bacterium]
MSRHAYLRSRLTSFSPLVFLTAASLLGCAQPGSGGGSGGNNGSGNGGNNSSGGSNGSGNGGNSSSGGSNGSGNGGNSSSSGGSNSSGSGGSVSSSGGSNGSGGSSAKGGSNGSGGSSSTGSGGSSSTGSGGSSSTGSGGSSSTGSGGSSSTGSGGSSSGGDPPGYYKTSEWGVTSTDWHGCVWTGKDSTVTGSTTSISPMDFTGQSPNGGPYEVKGTVYNDYNAVALLGFNLNEATTGGSTQCQYNAAAAKQNGPATATIPSSATGIAVNWSESKAPPTSFRIQLQGPDAWNNSKHIWCANINDTQGPSFISFANFSTSCWCTAGSTDTACTAANNVKLNPASDMVDALAFLVPGTVGMTAPYDFTIIGFAPGTSAADAPGGKVACGTQMGTIGSTTASQTASFARAAVGGTDCKTYIVQNNNWGNPNGSTQIVNYTGTSFTVQSSSGNTNSNNGQPQGAPASFPSTYIGANGNIANGTYNTWSDSGLPKQISSMQSVMTNFAWSGGTSGGDYNATYDVWFANSQPTPGYGDGVSGFLMVWLYKPGSRQPIGSSVRTATIADSGGTTHTFNVWVGPRGSMQTGTGPSSRPVISYVAQSTLSSLSFDLKKFIDDAVSHADTSNGVSGPFSSSWYLTDVFAGFEIWTGGDATNLKSTGFSCVVK